MATPNEINNWYTTLGKKQIDDLGINLNNAKDVERLRIPTLDGLGTRPLFEKGFTNSEADKQALYEYAKSGQLFAFQKGSDKPYQITENQAISCDKADHKEEKKASMVQKAAYRAGSFVWPFARFGIRLATRVANILTFGLMDKQIKEFEAGVDKVAGAASEYVFNVSAQKRERENKVAFGERFLNTLTRGYYHKEKIQRVDRERAYENQRNRMIENLVSEKQEWKKKTEEEIQRKAEEEKKSKVEKELDKTKEKMKNINQPAAEKTQEKSQGSGDKQAPEDQGKEMKTKLQMQYEEMRMAFGPGGGGFDEAVKIAQNMNQMIERLKNDPEALKASGMSEEKLKEFSNMCQNMEDVVKNGLEAKATLMVTEDSQKLTPEQKEQNICKMQLMHMVERAMVNSAFASYLDNDKQPEMDLTNMRSSRLFNAMQKDPEKFKESLYRSIKMLDSTTALKTMSPEDLAEFIAEPDKVRKAQTTDIQKGAQESRENRQQLVEERQKEMEIKAQRTQQAFTMQQNGFSIQRPELQQPQLQQPQMNQMGR